MGRLIDSAIPPTIYGDRFYLTRQMIVELKLPKSCPGCNTELTWDFMGEPDWAATEHKGIYRFQSVVHRHRRMAARPGSFLSVDICPCLTEHRNYWELALAGCEPLIDRWKTWNKIP